MKRSRPLLHHRHHLHSPTPPPQRNSQLWLSYVPSSFSAATHVCTITSDDHFPFTSCHCIIVIDDPLPTITLLDDHKYKTSSVVDPLPTTHYNYYANANSHPFPHFLDISSLDGAVEPLDCLLLGCSDLPLRGVWDVPEDGRLDAHHRVVVKVSLEQVVTVTDTLRLL